MWLRNPNLEINQIPYPDNIYEIAVRTITPSEDEITVNVQIYLNIYPDPKKSFKFEHQSIYFILRGLPNDDKQLLKNLYRKELIKQHSDKILDGTPLKDFLIVDE